MGRDALLKAVKENKPTLIPLPEINLDAFEENIDVLATFKEKVALVGGKIIELDAVKNMNTKIKSLYPNASKIISCTAESSLGTVSISEKTNPKDLESVDLAIVKGEFGVAENGAVWISEDQFLIRALPFITNDLVLILDKKQLCVNLHQAYKLIADRSQSFGLFISGPSKTADIEQCLVIGAQGAMSLTVLLV
jgi:L-lactate dehydrogenase complex protein LldG